MPPRKMRDMGMRQRDKDGRLHVLDDAEFYPNLTKALSVSKRITKDMDEYGKRSFLRALLMNGAPSPTLSIDSLNFLEWARKSLHLDILRKENPDKWKKTVDTITNAII